MSDKRWLSWIVATVMGAALTGCVDGAGNGPQGGQIGGVHGQEGGCDEEEEVIGVDDVSPLGFSAAEVAAAVSGERTAPLTWAKGGSTTATLSAGAPIAARFVRSTLPSSGGPSGAEPALALDCSDYLRIDVPLDFSTEDGAFDESLQVTLRATQADTASFMRRFDLDALQGSYEVTEVDPAEFKEVIVYLSATLSGSAVTGQIHGTAESFPSGSGPDASVSAQLFEVADF